jgi:chromosome segregation protein
MEYAGAQADLKVTLRDWYGFHWHRAQEELVRARASARAREAVNRDLAAAYEAAQLAYAAFRERLSGLRGEVNTWHRQSRELEAQREATGRALAVLDERRRALISTKELVLAEHERAGGQARLAANRLDEAERDALRLRAESDEAQTELSKVRESLEDRRVRHHALEEQLGQARAQIESSRQGRAEAQARLDELTVRLETQAHKMHEVRAAIAVAKTEVLQAEQNSARSQEKREAAEAGLTELESAVSRSQADLNTLEGEKRAALAIRADQEAEYARNQAQLEILEQAERSFAGYAEGARFLLEAARQSKLRGTRGALSAVLEVPAELEVAIAAALGETLDAVLLDGSELESALRLMETDGAERTALLPLEGRATASLRKPADPNCLGLAAELVRAPDDLRAVVDLILGQTLVIRDRSAARDLLSGLPPHARVVTLRGEVFRGDGLVIAGKTAAASSLSGPRRKRELQSALEVLSARLRESNAGVERIVGELTAKLVDADRLEHAARQARLEAGEAQAARHRAGIDLDSASSQLAWHNAQLHQLELESGSAASARDELLRARSSQAQTAAESQGLLRSLAEQLGELSLDEVQSQEAYWTTRAAVAEQGLQRGLGTRQERDLEATRLAEAESALAQRVRDVETALAALHAERESLLARESELNAQFEALRARLDPVELDLETAEQQEARLQEAEASAQRSLANAERILGQVQLDQVRREDVLNILREKITDDFGLVMFDYAAEVSGPVPLPFEGLVEDLPILTELPPDLEEQLTRQRGRLRRMGAINPEAKDEFERERERHGFLKSQVEDLHKAEADLNKVIEELDELTRRDFSNTFQAVDKEFRKTFVRLFGGGSARLALTDPDNLVETGIEIEARLPGRREQGLALLSGGERSLTAIALVFALLKVSPTPVCVMDEVDAMLDEANVGRFRDLLAELSKDTQFIIITHNRNTVQAADVIYGVTMGRDSTSQVISLRLDQVTDDVLK